VKFTTQYGEKNRPPSTTLVAKSNMKYPKQNSRRWFSGEIVSKKISLQFVCNAGTKLCV